MRRPKVKLDNLITFMAVAAKRNIDSAADELGLSASGVRKQLQNIETTFGIRLFESRRGSLAFTEDGDAFYQDTKKAVDQVLIAEEQVAARKAINNHHLEIGHSTNLPPKLIAEIVQIAIEDNHLFIGVKLACTRLALKTVAIVQLKHDSPRKRRPDSISVAFCIAIGYLSCLVAARAQSHKAIRGTVTPVGNRRLTVNSDEGSVVQVQPAPPAQIRKLTPASTDLKTAVAVTFDGISVGDRILISANVPDSGPAIAPVIYLMKGKDIARGNTAEQTDWKDRGIGGLVRSVHPTANTVTISVVSAAGAENFIIQLTGKTQLMRYASDSVKFADARPGPLASIQAGDQLTARGTKSADGRTMVADELVTGSFRNISGRITKIDIPDNTLTIKDIATNAAVKVALTRNTDMHVLPEAVATRFAARLKGRAKTGPAAGQDSA